MQVVALLVEDFAVEMGRLVVLPQLELQVEDLVAPHDVVLSFNVDAFRQQAYILFGHEHSNTLFQTL